MALVQTPQAKCVFFPRTSRRFSAAAVSERLCSGVPAVVGCLRRGVFLLSSTLELDVFSDRQALTRLLSVLRQRTSPKQCSVQLNTEVCANVIATMGVQHTGKTKSCLSLSLSLSSLASPLAEGRLFLRVSESECVLRRSDFERLENGDHHAVALGLSRPHSVDSEFEWKPLPRPASCSSCSAALPEGLSVQSV